MEGKAPEQQVARQAAQEAGAGLDTLEARLERHVLLGAISTRFLTAPVDQVDAAIDDALAVLGRYAGVDRIGICLFDETRERFTIVREWFREGLWSIRGFSEHVALFRYGMPRLVAGEAVHVLSPEEVAPESPNEAMLLRGLGIGSVVSRPIRRGNDVIGFASMASIARRTTPWPDWVLEVLRLPARLIVHALDRTTAEKKLRESRARWRSLCDSNVVGVYTLRPGDGAVVESNDAGLRMLGRTRAELARGISWEMGSPPEERENDIRMFEILQRTGRVMPWEKQGLRPDGTRVPMLVSLLSLAPQSDEMLSIAIDLSSRRRVAEELRRRDDIDRSHAELSRRLIDLAGGAVAEAVREALGEVAQRFGFDGVSVYDVEPGARNATRRSWWTRPGLPDIRPEADFALDAHVWWHERLRAGRIATVAGLAAMPEVAKREKASLARFGLESCISVPLLPGGTLRGFILFYARARMSVPDDLLATLRVFGDIVANAFERVRIETEISRALAALERRVEQRRGQLEASNAELEAFAYSVSHDLRAPLRTIDGMCQVLREDWAPELGAEALGLLERIQAAARRMAHLIDGLMLLSRVVRTQMEWRDVSVSDLVEGVVDELRQRNAGRDVEVTVAPGMTALGHPRLLRVAFEKVLENAFKFTSGRDGARVEVDAVEGDGTATFRIRDNGAGFDPELAGTLFGAFQRLHRPEEFEGHGIGLATVERVVRMHGGSACAEGRPGEGATIMLTLPRRDSVVLALGPARPAAGAASSR